jgi:hypothetical protein
MLDLYGLRAGFPGMSSMTDLAGIDRAKRIETAILLDIIAAAPELRADLRLIPYLQVHEYEGLLFSDTNAFATALGRPDLADRLENIRSAFSTPEDINDEPNTAPSKRIVSLYPAYKKVIEGTLAAQAIGLKKILDECTHFRDWVQRLEVQL